MPTATVTGSSPVLLVKDVQRAADYFRDALGFGYDRLWGDPPDFCICRRDGHAVFLAQVRADRAIPPYWKIRDKMWNAYFWVDNVDALYAEYQASGATIDYTLYDTSWGGREFGIQDIDDHDIGFGQVL